MAIATDDPCLMHLALNKLAVDINLVTNLTIWPIKRCFDGCEAVGVEQVGPIMVITKRAASRMTAAAVVNLRVVF